VADTLNHVIRVVRPFTGRIETYVGTGEPGYVDGPPQLAQFNRPTHVFSGNDHSLWIVDAGNHAIRYLDPLLTRVTTVIGTGTSGFNGDNLPPAETQLNGPTAVWATPDRRVFVADSGNQRIRLFEDR
jgi:streptogramin lyase